MNHFGLLLVQDISETSHAQGSIYPVQNNLFSLNY